jgi:hypothetical protein
MDVSGTSWKIRRDELVLLRVVRSLLDEIGITVEAVESYEKQQIQQPVKPEEKDEIEPKDDEEGPAPAGVVQHSASEDLPCHAKSSKRKLNGEHRS